MAGLVLGACTNSGSGTPTRSTAAATPPLAMAAEPGTWRPIPPAPIPPAAAMATAWTGSLLVVWGGHVPGTQGQDEAAGAAYDPVTDRWTVLPPAPIAGRFGARAIWTGREVLIWGGQSGSDDTVLGDGAAYDPAGRRWRALPDAPIGPRTGHEAVWTGREMLVWGGYERCCPIDSVLHDRAAAAYDPATDRWRLVAPVPLPWSGDDGGAVTVAAGGRPFLWREWHLAVLGADGRWAEIGGAPVPPASSPGEPVSTTTADPLAVGVATGEEIFVWSGSTGRLAGVAHRRGAGGGTGAGAGPGEPSPGAWRRTATLAAQSGVTAAAGGPGRIYAATGQSATVLQYRIAEDRWEELPPAPVTNRSFATLVWTGSELLFWGGVGDEGAEIDGAAWSCC